MSEADQSGRDQAIAPEVGWFMEVLTEASRIASTDHNRSFEGLKVLAEGMGDFTVLTAVVEKAVQAVGPESQYVADYQMWQETKQAGSHNWGFDEWRANRKADYLREYNRLKSGQ